MFKFTNFSLFYLKKNIKLDLALKAELNLAENMAYIRKMEFISGRYCARVALNNLGIKNYIVGIGDKRQPIWPIDICGSITHEKQFSAAVVAFKKDILSIGIDAINFSENKFSENETEFFINNSERNLIKKLLEKYKFISKDILYLFIFSIKETIFKCFSPLMDYDFFSFQEANILDIDFKKNLFNIKISNTISSLTNQKRQFFLGEFTFLDKMLITLIKIKK